MLSISRQTELLVLHIIVAKMIRRRLETITSLLSIYTILNSLLAIVCKYATSGDGSEKLTKVTFPQQSPDHYPQVTRSVA